MHLKGHKDDALRRMAQIFNANHFIISQPRPYIWPFPRDVYYSRAQQPDFLPGVQSLIRRFLNAQWKLRMRQWAWIVGVPYRQQQLMLEDRAPGITITLVPDASWQELDQVVRSSSKEALNDVVVRGEKSVWPCVSALKVRMDVEQALEKHHRRMKSKRI
jgi:TAG lipase/lysophosphatidylethanolamine acyltransferase